MECRQQWDGEVVVGVSMACGRGDGQRKWYNLTFVVREIGPQTSSLCASMQLRVMAGVVILEMR